MNRDPITCVIYTIITLGIYGLYWMFKLTEEANYYSASNYHTTGETVILLTIITGGIYGIYWAYKMGDNYDVLRNKPNTNGNILFLILAIVELNIINLVLLQVEINNYISDYQ